jgi:hypothetical protein
MLPMPAGASLPGPPDTLWTLTYDAGAHEEAFNARITGDGGYIICGSTTSPGPGNIDVYLVKTDSRGHLSWAETYGGLNSEEAYEVRQTSDGGYVLVGYTSTNTAGYFDVYFIRTDSDGDTLWTRTYGGADYDYGYSVAEMPDGGFIIAGRTSSFGKGGRAAYFIRTNEYGDTLWTRTHGGLGRDEAYSVMPLSDGGCMATGYTESYGAGERDLWLLRLDAAGDTAWTRTYGGALDERGEDVKRTSDRGFIIAGRSNSHNPPFHDMYVVRVDAEGGIKWARTYGGASMDHAYSVSQTLDGGFIVAGYTDSFGAGGRDMYIVRCDAAGDTLWTKTIGGESTDYGYSAEEGADGAYMISGWTSSMGASDGDAFLATLGASGGCPRILEVSDVPDDDGGYVNITWSPSFYDNPVFEAGIRRYKIWRRAGMPATGPTALRAGNLKAVQHPADRFESAEEGPLWELIGHAPADAGSVYTFLAETDCGPLHAGPCLGCFRISAHTGTIGGRFESPPMCGYSVINGAPPGGNGPGHGAQHPAQPELKISPAVSGRVEVRIYFAVPAPGRTELEVFDINGRKVITLLDAVLQAGGYSVGGGDVSHDLRRLAPGTYFVRLSAGSVSKSAKLVVVR